MSYVDKIKIAGTLADKRMKLTASQKSEIRMLISKGFSDVHLAEEYEVSRTTIYFIRNKTAYDKALADNKKNNIPLSKVERRKYMASLRKRKEDLSS